MNERRPSDIDFGKARLNPESVFESPEDVLHHPELTRTQKIEILQRWKYDACEVEVAEEEGMVGDQPTMLNRIIVALDFLKKTKKASQSAPTKQGGI